MAKRILKKGRIYRGQRRVYYTFLCAASAMILMSLIVSTGGFFWLINNHVDQAVRMSKIKNLQILANTLSEKVMNDLSVEGSSTWAASNVLSEYVSSPNLQFKESLKHQITEYVLDS